MPRRFFRRVSEQYRQKSPRPWYLRPLSGLLDHPVYLAVNRRSIAGGMGAGLAIGMLPIPGHLVLALLAGVAMRVNVAVALLVVWVANPLTLGPLLYAEYRLGAVLLRQPPQSWPESWTVDSLLAGFSDVWQPLLLGGGLMAILVGLFGYLATDQVWRWSVALRYQRRRAERRGTAES